MRRASIEAVACSVDVILVGCQPTALDEEADVVCGPNVDAKDDPGDEGAPGIGTIDLPLTAAKLDEGVGLDRVGNLFDVDETQGIDLRPQKPS